MGTTPARLTNTAARLVERCGSLIASFAVAVLVVQHSATRADEGRQAA